MDKQDRHYIGKQYFKDKVLENMGGIFQNNHTVGGKEFSYHVDPLADLLEVVCANIKVNVNYPQIGILLNRSKRKSLCFATFRIALSVILCAMRTL